MSEAQGQGQATSEAQATQSESQQAEAPEGYLSQETANKIIGDRVKETESKTAERERARIAEMFGYDDPAELDSVAEALKAWEDENETQADKLQKKLAKVEPVAKKAERYEAALKTHLESQREGLPEHITTLLDKMDPADQLDYITEHGESLRTPDAAKPRVNAPQTSGTGVNGQANITDPEQAHANFIASLIGGT